MGSVFRLWLWEGAHVASLDPEVPDSAVLMPLTVPSAEAPAPLYDVGPWRFESGVIRLSDCVGAATTWQPSIVVAGREIYRAPAPIALGQTVFLATDDGSLGCFLAGVCHVYLGVDAALACTVSSRINFERLRGRLIGA